MLLDCISVKSTKEYNLGLYVEQDIPIGTIVWHPCQSCRKYSSQDISSLDAFNKQINILDEYGYRMYDGSIMFPCNNAHLMNHSCEANVLDYGLDFGVAVRNIYRGEQISCDYRNWIYDPSWSFHCYCGAQTCIKIISSSSTIAQNVISMWVNKISQALNYVLIVNQPLRETLLLSSTAYKLIELQAFNYLHSKDLSVHR